MLLELYHNGCLDGSGKKFNAVGMPQDALVRLERLREAGLVQVVAPRDLRRSVSTARSKPLIEDSEQHLQLTVKAAQLFQASVFRVWGQGSTLVFVL